VSDLVAAIGLLLVFEGLLYGGFPGAARRMAMDMLQLPEHVLRIVGIVAMAIGVLLVWLARG